MRITTKLFIFLASQCQLMPVNAQVYFTHIDDSIVHSQYYPNPKSKFRGTMIFENGSETSLREWTENKTFFKCIKDKGNVFLYDRSGQGKSGQDSSTSLKKPTTAKLVNSKLMKLLERNQIKAPYILVAHSYGGLYAGYLARKYPDSVVGILMIDPVPSDFNYNDQMQMRFKSTLEKLVKISGKDKYRAFSSASSGEDIAMTEDAFYQQLGFHKTKEQVAELPPMSNKFPIIIASSSYMDQNAPIKGVWHALQKQWLNHNPHSIIFQVKSGHFIQIDRPELICEQLNKLVKIAVQSSAL